MKYYLLINGTEEIHLPNFGYLDMKDFLNINLFTSCYNSASELIDELRILKIIPITKRVTSIEIGTKKNDEYIKVSNTVAYKGDLNYARPTDIREFIESINDHEAIRKLLQRARSKCYSIINDPKATTAIKEKYQGALCNIENLINIDHKKYMTNAEFEEYNYRLNYIVETFFKKNGNPNYEELILASIFMNQYYQTHEIKSTNSQTIFLKEIEKIKSEITSIKEKMYPETYNCDPDHYMFLEEEDYTRIINESSSKKLKESVQADIKALEQLKPSKKL